MKRPNALSIRSIAPVVFITLALLGGGWCGAKPLIAETDSASSNDGHVSKVLESFLAHVDSLDQPSPAMKAEAVKIARESSADTAHIAGALTDALTTLYPNYAQAIESSDSGDADKMNRGLKLLTAIAGSDDPFLAADASFFLARMLMNDEQFEHALPRLDALSGKLASYSTHLGEVQYYNGVAQAGMLQYEDAIASFTEFVRLNPHAAERLRVSAWRRVQELQSIRTGQMEDVQQHMAFSRRRLGLAETDQATQKEQDDIVQMLARLIAEQQKKECSSSCKKKPSPKKSGKKKKPAAPKPPKGSKPSNSPKGGSSSNANGKAVDKSYDDSPASPWSRLRDRSRDPANNAVKEKLPARYRAIVEKYFEAANGDEKK